mmetsp:Transcript_27043/g.25889  ORF Transcript_27043/g.25889 Transcript_27043/m.25889 type:complete len:422 (-) Transcript_27043:111-1376(-)
MKILLNFVFTISVIHSILPINSSSIPSATQVSSVIGESSFKSEIESSLNSELENESYQSNYNENELKNEIKFDDYNQEGVRYESNQRERPVKQSISHNAASLLYNGMIHSYEPGDNIYQSDLMDKKTQYIKTQNTNDLYQDIIHGEVKLYRPLIFQKIRKLIGLKEEKYLECLNFDKNSLLCLKDSDSKSGGCRYFMASRNVYPNDGDSFDVSQGNIDVTDRPDNSDDDERVDSKDKNENNDDILNIEKDGSSFIESMKDFIFKEDDNRYQKFDIKGSSVGRTASVTSCVKKDNDLVLSNSLLNFGKCKNEILQILEKDVLFLNKHFFMDYSLLIGVEGDYVEGKEGQGILSDISRGKLVFSGSDGLVYHFGIIDFLQKFSFRKVLENWYKGLFHDKTKISAVAPSLYARRMLTFMASYSK